MIATPAPARGRVPSDEVERPLLRRIWVCLPLLLLLALVTDSPEAAARKRATPSAPRPPRLSSSQAELGTKAKAKGVTHIVERGQTLFRISQAYQVKVAVLMDANRLRASTPLKVGQRLFVPGVKAVKEVEAYRPLTLNEREVLERSLREEVTMPPPSEPPRPHVKTDAALVWPIVGPINSPFGPRWGKFHAGIDIGSPHYQEVVAAADGEVIYANDTGGALGKAVVLQHGRGLRSVYAHLSIIIAREGDTMRQGQAIAGVGETGRATGPHLHFEVRKNGVALNPEEHLPATIDELVRDLSRRR